MTTRVPLAAMALMMVVGASAMAQVNDGGGPPDPAQMRQRFADRMKEQLAVNDDEWKALQPKIEQVQQLRRDASARAFFFGPGGPGGPGGPPPGFGGGPGGPGGPRGGPDADRPPTPVQQKLNDLRETLDNKDAKPDDIKAKLAAFRDARDKARADLAKAQEDLRGLLTVRQESVMVMMGMLD